MKSPAISRRAACFALTFRAHLASKRRTRALAALFRAQQRPGPLPCLRRHQWRLRTAPSSRRSHVWFSTGFSNHDGQFVSGVSAAALLIDCSDDHDPTDPLASLSLDALRYGEMVQIDAPTALSARIYFYNRIPITPRWAHRLSTRHAVLEFLGLTKGGETRDCSRTTGRWRRLTTCEAGWQPGKPRASTRPRSQDAPAHKLYVSPMPGQLRDAIEVVVRVLTEYGPTAFSVGADLQGILRPDKLVLYFADGRTLDAVAKRLVRSLDGISSRPAWPRHAPSISRDGYSRGDRARS